MNIIIILLICFLILSLICVFWEKKCSHKNFPKIILFIGLYDQAHKYMKRNNLKGTIISNLEQIYGYSGSNLEIYLIGDYDKLSDWPEIENRIIKMQLINNYKIVIKIIY